MRRTLVIIPAYNEEKNINHVLSDIEQSGFDLDVVVIDDGSGDRTAEIARSRGVAVISLPFNLGIGGAVQTGFRYASENGYHIAIQFDADGQHIAGEIGLLLECMEKESCDVVIGSRFLTRTSYRTPFARRLGIGIFTIINTLIVGKRITDNTSGFRAYNRKAIEFLSRDYPSDYPEPEAVIVLSRNGFRISEVAVEMNQRMFGDSSIGVLGSLYYMVKVILSIFIGIFRQKERGDENGPSD